MNDITKMTIGIANVYLNGTNCRFIECNVGNMISDALFTSARGSDQQGIQNMTNTLIALFASGDIRASIEMGKITKFDLDTMLPYQNQLGKENGVHQF